MINSSVADKVKRRDSFQPRLSSIGSSRGSISRVAPTFHKTDENEANDVEAASQQPPPLPQKSDDLLPPPKSKVLRSIRRRSPGNRTRQSIMQIINDNTPGPPRPSFVETLLSPTDWLVNPEKTPPDESIHDLGAQKQGKDGLTPPWYILLPNGSFRLVWDFFMAWQLSVMAFYIPYRVCLHWEEHDEDSSIFIFESFVDALFAMDIILNFFTAYSDENGALVTHPKKIAWKYIKGFFAIDLVATIPFGYLLDQSPMAIAAIIGKLGRLPKMIKFVRAARLLKLLRVYKLQEFIMRLQVQYNVHHGISRMIKIVLTIMLVTHLVGCFWYVSWGGEV